jgi:hypothetical protein
MPAFPFDGCCCQDDAWPFAESCPRWPQVGARPFPTPLKPGKSRQIVANEAAADAGCRHLFDGCFKLAYQPEEPSIFISTDGVKSMDRKEISLSPKSWR